MGELRRSADQFSALTFPLGPGYLRDAEGTEKLKQIASVIRKTGTKLNSTQLTSVPREASSKEQNERGKKWEIA